MRSLKNLENKAVKKIKQMGLARPIATQMTLSSHKRIIDLAGRNQKIFLHPKPTFACGGSVQHFYHFIFTLCLPLQKIINRTDKNVVFVLRNCDPMTEKLLEIFPERVEICDDEKTIQELPKAVMRDMNTEVYKIKKDDLEEFKSFAFKSFAYNNSNSAQNKILLIERLPPDPIYHSDKVEIKGGGAQRRSIINHDELKDSIKSLLRDDLEFENLRLEEMSMADQAKAFDQAKLVIAQHGAALANLLWMRANAKVIEIFDSSSRESFTRLSAYKNLSYFRYFVRESHVRIDPQEFISWLKQIPELHKL